ncbi:hypothetical protein Tco_0982929 [Tanacetum coccineum]
MDLSNYEKEEFCLVIGLKFGVEYSDDYDDKDKPIPFRRRVFPSCLDGKRITGKDVEDLIDSNSFKKLDDDDAVSLCCIGILQLVLLGLEDRRPVHNWISIGGKLISMVRTPSLGFLVWPTYVYSLKDTNVKRWLPLYATESTTEDDKKTYSLLGSLGHSRTWYYCEGRVPAERLIPDEVEAGSEALDEEAILEEQILSLMHRFADRFTDRRVEINNLMVLHDHQLIDYVALVYCDSVNTYVANTGMCQDRMSNSNNLFQYNVNTFSQARASGIGRNVQRRNVT